MRCQDVMNRDVVVAAVADRLDQAARTMRERAVGFLPVCDGEGRAVGVVTDRDLVIRGLAQGDGTDRVDAVMTHEVVGCGPGDEVELAEGVMATRQKSRILVCDGAGRPVGVISLSDLAQRAGGNAGALMRRITWRSHDSVGGAGPRRAADLMKRDFVWVGPDTPVREVARQMRDHGVGFLPVCGDGALLGVITDRDLAIRAIASGRDPHATTVKQVMTREPVSCSPDASLNEIEVIMSTHRKSRLPVCDDGGRLVGVISLSDVAKHEASNLVASTVREVSSREACRAS